jgi:hypothetical protein
MDEVFVKILKALIVVLIACAQVSAEFTDAEKQQVVNQATSLSRAAVAAQYAMRHANLVPSDVGAMENFIANAIPNGWEPHQKAVLKLLDMYDASADRQATRDAAVVAIQATGYNYARGLLGAAQGVSTYLDTAKAFMDEAISLRASFDATLAYDEPRLDIQLAMPGATRTRSAVIGPHGSTLDMGQAIAGWSLDVRRGWTSLALAAETCPAFIGGGRGAAFASGHLATITVGAIIPALLASGIVPDWPVNAGDGQFMTMQENLDIMSAGGTTARPDEFFNVQLALEMLLMRTHVGPTPYDVNGRHAARGFTYDFSVMGQVWRHAIANATSHCDTAALSAFLSHIGSAVEANDLAWAKMDDVAYFGMLLLKHFQVFPPPGPGGGGFTCGPGTHEEDGVCLPDPVPPPTCPVFTLEFVPIDSTAAHIRCVEQ